MTDKERLEANIRLAIRLGYTVRVANADPYNTTMPFGCWELVDPDGQPEIWYGEDGTRFAEFYSAEEAWELVPDWFASMEAIDARVNAISPGEWWHGDTYAKKQLVYERPNERHPHLNAQIVSTGYSDLYPYAEKHAEFIAHAPDDIRTLLALVARLAPDAEQP